MVKNPSRSQGMRVDDSEFRYRKVQEAMLLYGMRPQGRGIWARKASEVCWGSLQSSWELFWALSKETPQAKERSRQQAAGRGLESLHPPPPPHHTQGPKQS